MKFGCHFSSARRSLRSEPRSTLFGIESVSDMPLKLVRSRAKASPSQCGDSRVGAQALEEGGAPPKRSRAVARHLPREGAAQRRWRGAGSALTCRGSRAHTHTELGSAARPVEDRAVGLAVLRERALWADRVRALEDPVLPRRQAREDLALERSRGRGNAGSPPSRSAHRGSGSRAPRWRCARRLPSRCRRRRR